MEEGPPLIRAGGGSEGRLAGVASPRTNASQFSIRDWPSEVDQIQIKGHSEQMHAFELRPVENGYELRGGQLLEPMVFLEHEPRPAVHLVGFLSQKLGSELRIFDAAGQVTETRRYEPVLPIPGAVGGLHGPARMTEA